MYNVCRTKIDDYDRELHWPNVKWNENNWLGFFIFPVFESRTSAINLRRKEKRRLYLSLLQTFHTMDSAHLTTLVEEWLRIDKVQSTFFSCELANIAFRMK